MPVIIAPIKSLLMLFAATQECSIGEDDTPNYGSPDEMFSKDLNPCLTPCISKSKSEVFRPVLVQLLLFY